MIKFISTLLIVGTLLSSCSDSDSDIKPTDKPTLPPASSMSPDLSAFGDDADGNDRKATVANWTYAALNVGVYSQLLFAHLAVPITAFKKAIDQEATFDMETRLWVWQYAVDINDLGYFEVKLTADVSPDRVDWKGYVSKEGAFEDFIWFEGASKLDASSGNWTLYQDPETPIAWLSSDWTKSEDATTAVFTVEKEGAHKGSFIAYEIKNNEDLDRIVTISDTHAASEIFVTWNSTSHHGRVKSQLYFGDEDYRCWDENLQDIACEQ